ncbi:hypothetical protein TKK_0003724 [Trichogramma kaykai]
MLTKEKLVKICDLGVSKIREFNSEFMTTKGRINCAGKPMYMAHEIYINRMEATEYSHMWSCACTVFELFYEKPVWHMTHPTKRSLEKLLEEKRSTNCGNLPEILKVPIKNYFKYKNTSRPKAKDIIIKMKTCNVQTQMAESQVDNSANIRIAA